MLQKLIKSSMTALRKLKMTKHLSKVLMVQAKKENNPSKISVFTYLLPLMMMKKSLCFNKLRKTTPENSILNLLSPNL